MTQTQLFDPVLEGRVLPFGKRDQRKQRIGHAATGGQDDSLAAGRVGLDDAGHPLHAGGVSDARPAEFMDFPGFHGQHAPIQPPTQARRPVAGQRRAKPRED